MRQQANKFSKIHKFQYKLENRSGAPDEAFEISGSHKKLEHKLNLDKYSIQTNVRCSIAGVLIAILSNLTIFRYQSG